MGIKLGQAILRLSQTPQGFFQDTRPDHLRAAEPVGRLLEQGLGTEGLVRAGLSLIPGGGLISAGLDAAHHLQEQSGNSPHLTGLNLRERARMKHGGHHAPMHHGGNHGKHPQEHQQEHHEVNEVIVDRAASKIVNEDYYNQPFLIDVITYASLAATTRNPTSGNTTLVMPFEAWLDYVWVYGGNSGVAVDGLLIGGQPILFGTRSGGGSFDPSGQASVLKRKMDMYLKQSMPIAAAINNLSASAVIAGLSLEGKGHVAATSHPGAG